MPSIVPPPDQAAANDIVAALRRAVTMARMAKTQVEQALTRGGLADAAAAFTLADELRTDVTAAQLADVYAKLTALSEA
jgi:hypothetical protein